jgi:chromosome partitioning protein
MDLVNEPIKSNQENIEISKETYIDSNYIKPVKRSLIEKFCHTSHTTISRLESEKFISSGIKQKHGATEYITYPVSDIPKIYQKTNQNFRKRGEAEVIAVWSQKGGAGKSSTTQHLASTLALIGKVLVIDIDSQGDATAMLGASIKHTDVVRPDAEDEPTIMRLIDWQDESNEVEIEYSPLPFEKVVKKITPNLHVIPADSSLGEINYSINRLPLKDKVSPTGERRAGALFLLDDVVQSQKHNYDYIIFDTPPSIEAIVINCLIAANRIIIPLELSAISLKVMSRNEDFLEKLKAMHPAFQWDKILIVPNKFRKENIKIKALSMLQDIYQGRTDMVLSQVVLPNSTVVDKSQDMIEPMYAMASNFGKEYKATQDSAREFTDLYWILCHEILDEKLTHLIYANSDSEAEG